jgi:hypothetical protein
MGLVVMAKYLPESGLKMPQKRHQKIPRVSHRCFSGVIAGQDAGAG